MSNYYGLSYALFIPFDLTLFILYLTVCFKTELAFPSQNNLLLNTVIIQRETFEQWLFYELDVVILKCVTYFYLMPS